MTAGELPTKVTVTNTYKAPPWIPPSQEFGEIEVTKVVTGTGAPTDDQYRICIEGLNPVTAKQCNVITGAGATTFRNLVPGIYKVTEDEPGAEYDVTIAPATVEVTIGEVEQATVTNDYTKQESLPPVTPVTPVTPVIPAAPTAPAEVSAQALPTTGSEGGLAAIAAILVTTGLGLTLLGKRRGTQQA